MKIHYRPTENCGNIPATCSWTWAYPGLPESSFTADPARVTCKQCLGRMAKYGVTHGREAYPEIPTLPVVATSRTHHIVVCPLCGAKMRHGHGPGHRGAHCFCWETGYYLGEPLPGAMPLDTDIPRELLKQAHALARETLEPRVRRS